MHEFFHYRFLRFFFLYKSRTFTDCCLRPQTVVVSASDNRNTPQQNSFQPAGNLPISTTVCFLQLISNLKHLSGFSFVKKS